jgi:hypothetical protein
MLLHSPKMITSFQTEESSPEEPRRCCYVDAKRGPFYDIELPKHRNSPSPPRSVVAQSNAALWTMMYDMENKKYYKFQSKRASPRPVLGSRWCCCWGQEQGRTFRHAFTSRHGS